LNIFTTTGRGDAIHKRRNHQPIILHAQKKASTDAMHKRRHQERSYPTAQKKIRGRMHGDNTTHQIEDTTSLAMGICSE